MNKPAPRIPRQRKAQQDRSTRSKHKSIVGYMEPMVDGFSDVRAACNRYLAAKGLDKFPDFVFGNNS